MFKRIAKFIVIYYIIGVVFLLATTSTWKEEGVLVFHLEIVRTSILAPAFWLQAFVWPVFIACYFPENFICHA